MSNRLEAVLHFFRSWWEDRAIARLMRAEAKAARRVQKRQAKYAFETERARIKAEAKNRRQVRRWEYLRQLLQPQASGQRTGEPQERRPKRGADRGVMLLTLALAFITVLLGSKQARHPGMIYLWPHTLLLTMSMIICQLLMFRRSAWAVVKRAALNPITLMWAVGWTAYFLRG